MEPLAIYSGRVEFNCWTEKSTLYVSSRVNSVLLRTSIIDLHELVGPLLGTSAVSIDSSKTGFGQRLFCRLSGAGGRQLLIVEQELTQISGRVSTCCTVCCILDEISNLHVATRLRDNTVIILNLLTFSADCSSPKSAAGGFSENS